MNNDQSKDVYSEDYDNETNILDVSTITKIIEDDREGETLFFDNFVEKLDEILMSRDITVLDFTQCEITSTADMFIDKIEERYDDMEIKRKSKIYSLGQDYLKIKYNDKYKVLKLKDIFKEQNITHKNILSSNYLKVFDSISKKVDREETFILDIRIMSYLSPTVSMFLLLSQLQVIFKERMIVEGFTDCSRKDISTYFKARALTVRPNLDSFDIAQRWHKLITPNNSVIAVFDLEKYTKKSGKTPISQLSKLAYVCSVTNLGIVVREISKINLASSFSIDKEIFQSNSLIRYDDIIQLNKIVVPVAWCNEYKQILDIIESTKGVEDGIYEQFKKSNLTMKNIPLVSWLTTRNYTNCYDILNNKISNQDFADYEKIEDIEQTNILKEYVPKVQAVFNK